MRAPRSETHPRLSLHLSLHRVVETAGPFEARVLGYDLVDGLLRDPVGVETGVVDCEGRKVSQRSAKSTEQTH